MKSEKEILKEAKDRFRDCTTTWGDYLQKQQELLRFISGDQWTYVARQNFEQNGFSALTSNRIPSYLRQITNEIRKNPPNIQIDAKDDGKVDTAKVIDDMIRNIQDEARADTAYCKAAEFAAGVGIGYILVKSKYESDKSMNQIVDIEPIWDVSKVMLDPNHKDVAGKDVDYAFITTIVTKEEYQRRYGHSALAQTLAGEGIGWSAGNKSWVMKDQVVICEYYFKDYQKKTLYQYFNKATGEEKTEYIDQNSDIDIDQFKFLVENNTIEVINERKVPVPTIRWCKLNEVEVLEQSVWPGTFIPIIPVKADEYWIEGKRSLVGAVEPAVDSQVMINYNLSLMAQLIQMAPKAPYIGTAAQFKSYEQQWGDINVSNQAFIPYNMDGNAPPPQRDLQEVAMQNMAGLCQTAEDAMQKIFGTFDPSQTQVAPESGKAILARQHQAYNSNFHFYDNLARSIQHVGTVIIEAIPAIYDTPRTIQTTKMGGEKRSVEINTEVNGVIEHDVTVGDYGVSIQTGASFGTKRQETVIAITEIMALDEKFAQNLAFIAIENMDGPGMKEASAIARAMVDPNVMAIATQGDKMEPEQVVQQLKQQVQTLTQQNQIHMQVGNQLTQELKISKQENELQKHDKTVELLKTEHDFKTKNRQMDIEEATTELQARLDLAKLKLEEKQLDIKLIEAEANIHSGMMDHGHKKAALDHKVNMDTMPDPVSESEIDSSVSSLSGDINPQ